MKARERERAATHDDGLVQEREEDGELHRREDDQDTLRAEGDETSAESVHGASRAQRIAADEREGGAP